MKKIIRNSLIGLLLIFGGFFLILESQIGGFRLFIITSASMEPAIDTGSLILTHYTHPTKLQRGDTITFTAPTKEREFVTHRITSVSHQQNLSIFKTKGDNNKNEDSWTLAGGAIVGKVITDIPYLGFLFSFMQSKIAILLFILLPAVYIIIDEISIIIATIKAHKKKKSVSPNLP